MATYYWVGGSGTWDGFTSTRWSATSGGAGGAGVPTDNDSVIFNSASSGVSYVVTCGSSAKCGQITTSAPATGTLTFSNSSPSSTLFDVYATSITPTINIHSGCLFTVTGTDVAYIVVQNYGATLTTVTFNGSGTNTQAIGLSITATGGVTFCNAQTCSFSIVQVSMSSGTFTCASSSITINRGVATGSGGTFYVSGASTVNMAATNLVAGSLTTGFTSSTEIFIDAGATPTWSIAGLNITLRSFSGFSNSVRIGQSATTAHPTIGSVTLEGITTSYVDVELAVARCTTITVRDVTVNVQPSTSSDPIFSASGAVVLATTLGSVSLTEFIMAAGSFSTVTFGSTFTVTGLSTNYANATVAGTATLASLTVTDGTFSPDGAVTISGATTLTRGSILTTLGQGYSLTTGDITGTGQTAIANYLNIVQVETLVCSSLTLTNTGFYANTSATINGGVGKTFSFTVNALAPVLGDYPEILVNQLTVSTPTMSIVGTATKRVVCSPIFYSGATWTITPTPTLQFVTFIKCQINFGVSNYTGTSLGTDGLSVGVVGQAPRSVYCVAVGSQNFDAAIWATTPGGVGATANYPLPQDTIIFTTAVVGAGNITLTSPFISLYFGSVTVEASTNTVSIAEDTGFPVNIFGNIYTSTTAVTYIGRGVAGNGSVVEMSNSGLTTRYVSGKWSMGEGTNASFNLSAFDNNPTYIFPSGTLATTSLQIPTGLGGSLSVNTDGLTSITCPTLNVFLGNINFATTEISATTATFTNSSPSLVMEDTPYTLTLNGTTSSGSPATYTNNSGTYRGGFVVLRDGATSFTTYYFRLQGLNVRRLTLSSNGATGAARTVTLFSTGATVKDFTTAGSTVSWTINTNGGVRTIVKDGGGRVQLTGNLTATGASASPANTFYVSGTLSQTGGATGWVQGIAPSSNSGFLFF